MQNGSVIRRGRKNHSDIWQFRWWEKTSDGRRIYRRRVIGTVDQIPLGNHPKPAIDNHFKTGHREAA